MQLEGQAFQFDGYVRGIADGDSKLSTIVGRLRPEQATDVNMFGILCASKWKDRHTPPVQLSHRELASFEREQYMGESLFAASMVLLSLPTVPSRPSLDRS